MMAITWWKSYPWWRRCVESWGNTYTRPSSALPMTFRIQSATWRLKTAPVNRRARVRLPRCFAPLRVESICQTSSMTGRQYLTCWVTIRESRPNWPLISSWHCFELESTRYVNWYWFAFIYLLLVCLWITSKVLTVFIIQGEREEFAIDCFFHVSSS